MLLAFGNPAITQGLAEDLGQESIIYTGFLSVQSSGFGLSPPVSDDLVSVLTLFCVEPAVLRRAIEKARKKQAATFTSFDPREKILMRILICADDRSLWSHSFALNHD